MVEALAGGRLSPTTLADVAMKLYVVFGTSPSILSLDFHLVKPFKRGER